MSFFLSQLRPQPWKGEVDGRSILERAWVRAALFWGTLVVTWVTWSGVAHAVGL